MRMSNEDFSGFWCVLGFLGFRMGLGFRTKV